MELSLDYKDEKVICKCEIFHFVLDLGKAAIHRIHRIYCCNPLCNHPRTALTYRVLIQTSNWWPQRTSCYTIINPEDHQKGSSIHPTPYLNVTVSSVWGTHSSSRSPGLSSWQPPSQMFRWIRPMTPPEGSAVISSIPDLPYALTGQNSSEVFQEDKTLFHLISLRELVSLKNFMGLISHLQLLIITILWANFKRSLKSVPGDMARMME